MGDKRGSGPRIPPRSSPPMMAHRTSTLVADLVQPKSPQPSMMKGKQENDNTLVPILNRSFFSC
jgi:hypothetical protein